MYLILLEAFMAGLILVVIVWWTMFTGRPKNLETQKIGDLVEDPSPKNNQPDSNLKK